MIGALLRRGNKAGVLDTPRLRLVAITRGMLEAETEANPSQLADLLGACVPRSWPPELWDAAVWVHTAAQLEAQPATAGWQRYMITAEKPARLVGCLGAFPCAHGDVELGYSVANDEQGKGFATEAAQALTQWLLQRPEIRSVSAQAFETAVASVRVMQRCGMVCVGAGDAERTVRYRRWRT